MPRNNVLRRYTSLGSLIYMLSHKKLTLVSPEGWKDRNDAHFLKRYQEKKDLKSVLALCFTEGPVTYHHWHVFAGGSSGVSIEFNKTKLLGGLKSVNGITMKSVVYKRITDLRHGAKLKVNDLPFLKRHLFSDEKEFRIIYESKNDVVSTHDLDFDLAAVSSIVTSPRMHKTVSQSVKGLLRGIEGCETLRIGPSTLTDNEEWKGFADDSVTAT